MDRNMELKGKRAIVTGGASGFGYGIALHFINEGAKVLIADKNFKLAKETASKLGENAFSFETDVSKLESVIELQKEAETLSQEEITDIQRSIQEKSKDLEFIVGKIQTKQNETADKVFRDLNPSVQKILQELIAAKQVKVLLGRENVLFADTSLDLTDDVTSMLDVAAQSE